MRTSTLRFLVTRESLLVFVLLAKAALSRGTIRAFSAAGRGLDLR